MKAQSSIYHVNCFTCSVCNSVLQTGDHFGIYESKIYCRHHYEQLQYSLLNSTVTSTSSQPCSSPPSTTQTPPFINSLPTTTPSCMEGMLLNSTNPVTSTDLVSYPTNPITSATDLISYPTNPITSAADLINYSTNPITSVTDLVSYPPSTLPPTDFQSTIPTFDQQPPAKNRTSSKKKRSQDQRIRDQQWSMGK